MVELFDLQWWLTETALYAVQFASPHVGDADEARFHEAFLAEVVPAVAASPTRRRHRARGHGDRGDAR